MMATALGAAVSDGLADGRIVSGVGGQYNFVAMAHAIPAGRSVLMLRATRSHGGAPVSNIRWNYGHITIPRHLRDVYISEYGIADLRGKVDEDCVIAMTAIADAGAQQGLLQEAIRDRKLRADFTAPDRWRRNTTQNVHDTLAPFRADGTLPDYPLGSDFTAVEQRLVKALTWLKANTANTSAKLRTLTAALTSATTNDDETMQRMQLHAPRGLRERLDARLLALGLARTR